MKQVLSSTKLLKSFVFVSVFSLVLVQFLTSCSLNIPTFKRDAGEAMDKAGDKAEEISQDVKEKFDPERHDLFDPQLHMSRADVREAMSGSGSPVIKDVPPEPVLPDVSSLLIEPRPPLVGQDKLVSISVTEDIPLRDVIMELSRRAEVDVEIDPGISGGVILRAKDKPFSEVIERISELSGLRYSVKNGVLKVERDSPFIVNYNVSILNMVRSNNSAVSLSTQVLSSAVGGEGGGGGGGLNSGSTNELTSSYEGDIWQEIENTMNNIVGNYSGNVSTVSLAPGAGTTDTATDDVLGAAPTATAPTSATNGFDKSSVIAINKNSGIVTVLASERQHREVKQYLDHLIRSQSSQVLIEAKIIEVNLTDEYRTGINWSNISNGGRSGRSSADLTAPFSDAGVDSVLTIDIFNRFTNFLGTDDPLEFDNAIKLMEKFGTVKTLSNPRINAMNNQQAVLTFAENQVFFDVDVQSDESGTGADTESSVQVDTTTLTVPIGVILTLQPSIDLDNNEITMNIRPTLSRVTGTVDDPGVAVALATVNDDLDDPLSLTNSVPIVEVREIDSILRVKNGQIMVIGGLIEERSENEDAGVPGLSNIPYIGNAFKSVKRVKSTVETVIFIKATIVPGYGVEKEDKDFYRSFSTERRQMSF